MISKNILAITLFTAVLGLLFAPTSASASLIGDSATVELFTGGASQGSQTATVDTSGTPEFNYFTGPDNSLSVDIESSTIQIDLVDGFTGLYVIGNGLNPIVIQITDLDWVGMPGTIVGASIVSPPSGFGETVQVTGPHSVEVAVATANNAFAGGTLASILVQLQTSHTVAGELLPIDSTALMLAGLQTSAIWLVPSVVGIAGVGFYVVRAKMNKDA